VAKTAGGMMAVNEAAEPASRDENRRHFCRLTKMAKIAKIAIRRNP
jgi:hypothetical protein